MREAVLFSWVGVNFLFFSFFFFQRGVCSGYLCWILWNKNIDERDFPWCHFLGGKVELECVIELEFRIF